jgi:hypothetical protein
MHSLKDVTVLTGNPYFGVTLFRAQLQSELHKPLEADDFTLPSSL